MYKMKKSPCVSELRCLLLTKPSIDLYWEKDATVSSAFVDQYFVWPAAGGFVSLGNVNLPNLNLESQDGVIQYRNFYFLTNTDTDCILQSNL